MPLLQEWQVHHPRDWTPRQAGAYASHVLTSLTHGIAPVNQALGPSATSGILCSCVAMLAKCNPLAARDICKQLANVFDIVDALDPLKEGEAVQ